MQKINQKIIAYLMLILALVIAIFVAFVNPQNLSVKNFNSVYKPVKVNMVLKNKVNPDNLYVCFDKNCIKTESEPYNSVYSASYVNQPVKTITYKYDRDDGNFKNNVEDVVIYVASKEYHFKDKISIDNSTDVLNKICAFILAFFYNFKYFILSYILILGAFFIFIKNNYEIKKSFIWLCTITIIAFILRVNNLTLHPFWCAENYTVEVAMENFKTLFKDAGNPPLFFVLEYLFTMFLPKTLFVYRFLPMIFGGLLPVAVYKTLEDTGKNTAILGSILAAISLTNIFYSQEVRGYSLFMLLSVLIVYFLFRYLKNRTLKNLIFYTVCSIALINSYYYLILLAAACFIWGVFSLLKDKKDLLKFIFANMIAFLSFIPWAFLMLNEALSSHFNLWIPKISLQAIGQVINCYFLNIFLFLIFILLLCVNFVFCMATDIKKNQEKKKLFYFSIFSIIFVVVSSVLISIFVKPIFHFKFFASIYGLFIILETILTVSVIQIEDENKNKIAIYGFIVLLLFFMMTSKTLYRVNVLEPLINLIERDSIKYKDSYNVYALNPGNIKYLNSYEKLKELNYINWQTYESDYGEFVNEFNKSKYAKNGKGIVYFTYIGVDLNNIKIIKPYKVYIYQTNYVPVAKIVFVP